MAGLGQVSYQTCVLPSPFPSFLPSFLPPFLPSIYKYLLNRHNGDTLYEERK